MHTIHNLSCSVTFRSILKSTIKVSEAASIEDTRRKELLVSLTFPKRGFVCFTNFVLSMPTRSLSRKIEV
jgi:hypothetical protein